VQALLGALEVALELYQSGARPQTPSVPLGSQKGEAIAVVVDVCLELLDWL
jgi:hypothetical protein